MPLKNRNKFGLSIPVDPRWKAFEGLGNTRSLPCTPNFDSTMTSPTPQRNPLKSPRNTTCSSLPPSTRPNPPPPPPPKNKIATAVLETEETEELQRLVHAPPYRKSNKKLTKQLSLSERTRDIAWEKRRKQVIRKEKRRNSMETFPGPMSGEGENLTDADLHELRGCIELGFGFSEEDGHRLCETLPALDLYFAVNRQLSLSPVSSPGSRRSSASINGGQSSLSSPQSDESWRICSPGDSPQQVKTKLRRWAQVVACSVMQSS
ncbi:hypothetical protein V2J09_022877 [Rumex salicifolius]